MLLNAGAGLFISGKPSVRDIALAGDAIDSGAAAGTLAAMAASQSRVLRPGYVRSVVSHSGRDAPDRRDAPGLTPISRDGASGRRRDACSGLVPPGDQPRGSRECDRRMQASIAVAGGLRADYDAVSIARGYETNGAAA